MTNLPLYIQALPCHSIMTLLQHAKVEGDTVYVSDTDYGDAEEDFGSWHYMDVITILDTIIHNKFNCPYFQFIQYPNRTKYYWDRTRYHWDEEKRHYIEEQLK